MRRRASSVQPEDLTARETGGVAVGRTEADHDLVVGIDARSHDLNRRGAHPADEIVRRVVPQRLLDRRRDELGSALHLVISIGRDEQLVHHIANEQDRRPAGRLAQVPRVPR